MHSAITAFVLGVGEFGKHYAGILSQLNGRNIPGVPTIEKLIVSRTQLNRAEDLADSLRRNVNCKINDIIGVAVSGIDHLRQVMKRHTPQFTAITAKDKILADTVHALYAVEALTYGPVLCEKPFSNAKGDGSSLQYLHKLKNCKFSELFGLEVPLAVVTRQMMQNSDLRHRILSATRLEFYWEARDRGDNNVIDDLVLHPWSLIPPQFKTKPVVVRDLGNQAEITINLHNSHNQQIATGRIFLRAGGNFRGMMIDDFAVSIIDRGRSIKLVQLSGSLKDAVLHQNESLTGNVLLQVDNPLEQHIVAALRRKPLVGLSRTYESQLFLEELRGYND